MGEKEMERRRELARTLLAAEWTAGQVAAKSGLPLEEVVAIRDDEEMVSLVKYDIETNRGPVTMHLSREINADGEYMLRFTVWTPETARPRGSQGRGSRSRRKGAAEARRSSLALDMPKSYTVVPNSYTVEQLVQPEGAIMFPFYLLRYDGHFADRSPEERERILDDVRRLRDGLDARVRAGSIAGDEAAKIRESFCSTVDSAVPDAPEFAAAVLRAMRGEDA